MLRNRLNLRNVVTIAICLVVTVFTSCGAGGNKQQQTTAPENENIKETQQQQTVALEKAISGKPQELASTLKNVGNGIKYLTQDLVKVNNPYADVYSLLMVGKPTIFVIFNSNNTKNSMLAFMKIIDETADKLIKEYKKYAYIALDNENNLVLTYEGDPSEEIFSVEGYDFYIDESPSEMNVDCPFRRAYADIVKEKLGVKILTEWDYYMFRNKMSAGKDEKQTLTSCPLLISTSTLGEIIKINVDWNRFSKNFEEYIKICENREEMQDYMKNLPYGIIWFDNEGKRIMAETISGPINNRERDRRWYNGYKIP